MRSRADLHRCGHVHGGLHAELRGPHVRLQRLRGIVRDVSFGTDLQRVGNVHCIERSVREQHDVRGVHSALGLWFLPQQQHVPHRRRLGSRVGHVRAVGVHDRAVRHVHAQLHRKNLRQRRLRRLVRDVPVGPELQRCGDVRVRSQLRGTLVRQRWLRRLVRELLSHQRVHRERDVSVQLHQRIVPRRDSRLHLCVGDELDVLRLHVSIRDLHRVARRW